MIYTMLKSCFNNTEPKLLNHRDIKHFSQESFKEDFSEDLCDCGNSYDDFEHIFTSKLNKYAPKNHRDFKHFSQEAFKEDLSEALCDCGNSYDDFEHIFTSKLNKHAPKKKKWIKRNNKPHINKALRQAIMKRSRLKNKNNP